MIDFFRNNACAACAVHDATKLPSAIKGKNTPTAVLVTCTLYIHHHRHHHQLPCLAWGIVLQLFCMACWYFPICLVSRCTTQECIKIKIKHMHQHKRSHDKCTTKEKDNDILTNTSLSKAAKGACRRIKKVQRKQTKQGNAPFLNPANYS